MESGGQRGFDGAKTAFITLGGKIGETGWGKARLFDGLTPSGASCVPGTYTWGGKGGCQRRLKVLQSGLYMTAIPGLPSRPSRTEVIGGVSPGRQGSRSWEEELGRRGWEEANWQSRGERVRVVVDMESGFPGQPHRSVDRQCESSGRTQRAASMVGPRRRAKGDEEI